MQLRVQLGEHRVVDLDVQWMRIQPDPPVDCVDPLALCHWERKGERSEGRESVLLVRGRIFLEFLIKKNTFRIFGRQWLIKVYVLPWHGTLRVFGDLHSGGSCGWIHLCGSKFSLWIFCRVKKKKEDNVRGDHEENRDTTIANYTTTQTRNHKQWAKKIQRTHAVHKEQQLLLTWFERIVRCDRSDWFGWFQWLCWCTSVVSKVDIVLALHESHVVVGRVVSLNGDLIVCVKEEQKRHNVSMFHLAGLWQ